MPNAFGLIRAVSAADMQKSQDAQKESAEEANNAPVLQGLAKYVMDKWSDARDAKQAVLPRIQKAHRARAGEYDPAKLEEIRKFGGSEVYLRVIANKCMILEALLRDVYLGQTDKPWSLRATPKPTLPIHEEQEIRDQLAQEIAAVYAQLGRMPNQLAVRAAQTDMRDAADQRTQESARKAVERMEHKMEDQLMEGGFPAAIGEFLSDFVTYPTAIIKGPVLRKRSRIVWAQDETGKTVAQVTEQVVPEFERVDPFRAYPAAGAQSTQDGPFIEHVSLSYDELYDMLGSPGVNEKMLRAALSEADNGGLSDWMGWSEMSDTPDPDDVAVSLKRKTHDIDCILFYGPVRGKDLVDWGIEDPIDDPDATQEAAVWLVGKWVVKAHLNYDPLGIRPYFNASYKQIPGQFWGEAVPDMLADVSDVMQVGGRALANNMAMASGPMMGINVDRLQTGEDLSTIHPWMQLQLTNSEYGNMADRAIEFFQPQMHAQEIIGVLDKFYQYADSFSMVPRSAAGDAPTGGVGRTASGMAIQADAAGKGLKAGVLNVDAALSGLLGKLYNHNMLFDPDETLKGDAQAIARGATSLMQMESLRLRRNEVLQVTNNPTDLQIMGLPGRAELLRTTFDDLDVDVSRVIPSREKMAAMVAGPQPEGQPGQPSAPGAPPAPGPGMSQETLDNGTPTTDNFSPNSMRPVQGFAQGGLVPEGTWTSDPSQIPKRAPFVDFGAMQRKAGTSAAIAASQALAANPEAAGNIAGTGMSFDDVSRKAGVAAATRALRGEPEPEPEPDQGPGAPAPFDDPTQYHAPTQQSPLRQAPASSLLDDQNTNSVQYSNLFDV